MEEHKGVPRNRLINSDKSVYLCVAVAVFFSWFSLL